MAWQTIFLTGFPGFLGGELLPRILGADGAFEAVCLVQSRYLPLARARTSEIESRYPRTRGRIGLIEGDITLPDLGLGDAGRLRSEVREVYHLAAVYDLSVQRDLAMRVNHEGTRHVVRFCRRCPDLHRLHYVSTCYVSGRYRGLFGEHQLEEGQAFHNVYEESKHLAEVEVRRAMEDGLPATIYRPPIVVGDSRTGATRKFDGPYHVFQWLLRQPPIAVMPVVGRPERHTVNVVPSDFVVDAIAALSRREDTAGRTFHLADPDPLTAAAMLREMARATGRRVVRIRLPRDAAKWAIDHLPGVYRVMRIPSAAVDYFAYPTHYATDATREILAESGIRCPSFAEYVDNLVAYMRDHPDVESRGMA